MNILHPMLGMIALSGLLFLFFLLLGLLPSSSIGGISNLLSIQRI